MSTKLILQKPLVSVDWLAKNINASNLVVIDATLTKVTWETKEFENQNIGIKNARFLDIKNVFSDTSISLPSMMLSAEKFQEKAQLLGLNKDTAIVVYDTIGIFSSPRVWWMFKSMGHHNIAVLNGGLPEWIRKGYSTEVLSKVSIPQGNFKATYNKDFFSDYKVVLNAITDDTILISDARSHERFMGVADEPREGLRAGHIPSSKNVPYLDLQVDGKMIAKEKLVSIFNSKYKNKKNVIFSCGSGITACILALGADISGLKNGSVYDGSWTEWGSNHELPIEK